MEFAGQTDGRKISDGTRRSSREIKKNHLATLFIVHLLCSVEWGVDSIIYLRYVQLTSLDPSEIADPPRSEEREEGACQLQNPCRKQEQKDRPSFGRSDFQPCRERDKTT